MCTSAAHRPDAAAAVASITIVVTLAVAAIATLFARRLPKGTLPWMP